MKTMSWWPYGCLMSTSIGKLAMFCGLSPTARSTAESLLIWSKSSCVLGRLHQIVCQGIAQMRMNYVNYPSDRPSCRMTRLTGRNPHQLASIPPSSTPFNSLSSLQQASPSPLPQFAMLLFSWAGCSHGPSSRHATVRHSSLIMFLR